MRMALWRHDFHDAFPPPTIPTDGYDLPPAIRGIIASDEELAALS